jgi:hypothetical protein
MLVSAQFYIHRKVIGEVIHISYCSTIVAMIQEATLFHTIAITQEK